MNVIGWVFIALFVMSVPICMGHVWVIQVPLALVLGWVRFLLRVVPEMTWRWGAIAEPVAVGAVLGVGTHLFLRRLWRQLRPEDARPWPVRWSVSLVALIVLLFSATMATVGIGHPVGWLASGQAPLVESSWRFMPSIMEWGNEGLCQTALDLSKSGVPDARIAQLLLGDADKRAQAERLHVVPWRGPGGEAGFLVFPRDPLTRELSGGVHCGGDWSGTPSRRRSCRGCSRSVRWPRARRREDPAVGSDERRHVTGEARFLGRETDTGLKTAPSSRSRLQVLAKRSVQMRTEKSSRRNTSR